MSATAPSVPPPLPQEITQEMTQTITAQPPPGSIAGWLEFSLGGRGSGSSSTAAGSGGAGPSTIRYGKEADFPITDMADAMFNSGSSSTNSMEFIFPSMEDKWEPGDKKN